MEGFISVGLTVIPMGFAERAVRGVVNLGLLNGTQYVMNLLVQVLLARLLTPELFGVVFLSASMLTFMSLIARWGVAEAIVQETEHEAVFSTIFWLRSGFSALLLATILLGSLALEQFYGPRVVTALRVLAIGQIVQLFASPFKAVIQREMGLTRLGLINMVTVIVSGIPAVWLAVEGEGLWALLFYYAGRNVLRGVGQALASPTYPAVRFDVETARWFVGFAKGMFGAQVLTAIEANGDDFLIGTLTGTAALGVYSIAWRMARLLNSFIQPAIRDGILPTFSRLKDTDEQSRRGLEFILRMQLNVAVPGYIVAGLVAADVLPAVFGRQWVDAIPVFRLLTVGGVLFPLISTMRHFYFSRGQQAKVFRLLLFSLPVMIVGMVLLLPRAGAIGAAVAIDLMLLCALGLLFRWLRVDIGLRVSSLLVPPVVAGTFALLVGTLTRAQIADLSGVHALLSIVTNGLVVALIYYSTMFAVDRNALTQDIQVLRRALL